MNKNSTFMKIAMALCLSGATELQAALPDGDDPRNERKIDRMERILKLDDATSEKFAPLYQEYREAMKACRQDIRNGQAKPDASDKEIVESLQDRLSARRKMLDTQEKYLAKFSKILNARQLETLFAEPTPKAARPKAPGLDRRPDGR